MNCAALVCGDTTIAIDCGIGFTDEHGAELVHADFSWLVRQRPALAAVVITHGHEDHIGALPYFLKELSVPVFAPPYAAALIEDRLREHRLKDIDLRVSPAGSQAQIGSISCIRDDDWFVPSFREMAAALWRGQSLVDLFVYTAGWNDQLADVGGERLTGWCTGAPWVRPLEAVEVYTYARALTLQASGSRLLDFIASAQPPSAEPVGASRVSCMAARRSEIRGPATPV